MSSPPPPSGYLSASGAPATLPSSAQLHLMAMSPCTLCLEEGVGLEVQGQLLQRMQPLLRLLEIFLMQSSRQPIELLIAPWQLTQLLSKPHPSGSDVPAVPVSL